MMATTSTVWLPPSLIHSRFDANYNSPLAVATRAKLRESGESRFLEDVIVEMRCGPFGSTIVASEHSSDGEVILIQPTDISGGGFTLTPGWKIRREQLDEKGLSLCPPNSLLFARKGIYAHCAVLPALAGEATLGSSMIGAVIDKSKADAYFLEAYFRGHTGSIILSSLQMITASPTIGTGELADAVLPYPAFSLQRAIGNKVRAAERLRAAAEAAKRALESSFPDFALREQRTSGQWLTDGDLDTERLEAQYYQPHFLELMQAIESLPCAVVPLQGLVASTRHGASVTGANTIGGSVRFIRGTEIKPNRIATDDVVYLDDTSVAQLATSHYVRRSDLLVTRSGTVGSCAVARPGEVGVAFGSFVIAVQISEEEGIAPEYVAAFLNSPLGQAQFRREENGAVQMNINNGELGRIQIPLFSDDFRDKVVKEVGTYNANLDRAELLVKSAIADVELLIDGKLDEAKCISEGRKLAKEFGLETP